MTASLWTLLAHETTCSLKLLVDLEVTEQTFFIYFLVKNRLYFFKKENVLKTGESTSFQLIYL